MQDLNPQPLPYDSTMTQLHKWQIIHDNNMDYRNQLDDENNLNFYTKFTLTDFSHPCTSMSGISWFQVLKLLINPMFKVTGSTINRCSIIFVPFFTKALLTKASYEIPIKNQRPILL